MATIFADTFTGTGTLNGHTPDTQIDTEDWVVPNTGSYDLTLSSGAVVSANQGSPTDYGNAHYGDAATDFGIGNAILATFVLRTGSDVSAMSDDYGFRLYLGHSGLSIQVTLNIDNLDPGQWRLNGTNVSLSANTDYTGTVEIADGNQEINFLGQTINTSDAFLDATGFNYVEIGVGAGFSLKDITAETIVAEVNDTATSAVVFGDDVEQGFVATEIASEVEFASLEADGQRVESQTIQPLVLTSSAPATLEAANQIASAVVFTGEAVAPIENEATSEIEFTSLATQGIGHDATSAIVLTSLSPGSEVASLLDESAVAFTSSLSDENSNDTAFSSVEVGSTVEASKSVVTLATSSVVFGDDTSEDRGVEDVATSTLAVTSEAASTLAAFDTFMSSVVFTSRLLREALARAWAMNASTAAMSRYDGLPYRSAAAIGGKVIGLGDDGFFLLAGIEDDDDPIDAEITTGFERMGSDFRKRILDMVVFHQSDGPVDVTITEWGSERGSFTYQLDAQPEPTRRGRRVKPGRGLRASAFKLSFTGPIQAFDSASLDVVASETERRF